MDLYYSENKSCEEYFDQYSLNATVAKIHALQTGMALEEIETLVFSIETLRPIFEHTSRYLHKDGYKVPRTIEFDPTHNFIFIHLKTHNLERVGKGAHKVVTTSILYDRDNPQLVANAVTKVTEALVKEIQVLEKFKGREGIVPLISVSKHRKRSGRQVYEIITPLYNRGSLKSLLRKNPGQVPSASKIKIMRDVLKGAVTLIENGYIMRDNHCGNIFVRETEKGYEAVLGDLGGYTDELEVALQNKPFGPSCRSCPPDILLSYLAGTLNQEDLLSYYVFALGRIMYECCYETEIPWRKKYDENYQPLKKLYYEKTDPDIYSQIESLRLDIFFHTSGRIQELLEKEQTDPLTREERFERIALSMISPDREQRKTVAHWLQELELLLE